MAKVTYLLGAGASAGALPTVTSFPEELKKIIDWLKPIYDSVKVSHYYPEFSYSCKWVLQDLEALYDGCSMHISVDTYSKMLYLTAKDAEYKRAKCAIILFFELYRYLSKKYDKRYDAFLAALLNKDAPRLPADVNIISWNYDCEFEKALLNFSHLSTINDVYNELNVVHKNSNSSKGIGREFGMIKINGTMGFYDHDKNVILGLDMWKRFVGDNDIDPERVTPILKAYTTYVYEKKYEPMISFAWDNDTGTRKIAQEIRAAFFNTKILVIVGYSFPYFNRKMDQWIFDSFDLKNGNRDIYIQDKEPERLEGNVKQLKRSGNTLIQTIDNVDQFYIPHEL